MNYIDTSIFELFEIGPGPSSSHTIGPMKAAYDFINSIRALPDEVKKEIVSIDIYLYGSLASTGMGHGTHKAILSGLLGYLPSNVKADFFKKLFKDLSKDYTVLFDNYSVRFNFKNIHFRQSQHNKPFQNTLVFRASTLNQIVFEREYYSIGGGFIKYKGELESLKRKPMFYFTNMNELKKVAVETNKNIPEIVMENEIVISQLNKKIIFKKLKKIVEVMINSVEHGLQKEGLLPGPIKLHRKASLIYKNALALNRGLYKSMGLINSYAFAASEENADSEITVTAPTSGSCGIIPAIIYYLHFNRKIALVKILEAMLTSAAIGLIIKQNASLSGAEVGCQGEIGVASAMAAALICQVYQKSIKMIENAAEIALEHHLGLTCDPIGGYVQIPCIERNAVGAIKAYNAFVIASLVREDMHKVSLDSTIKSMYETGKDMLKKYKETAKGGLAVCYINC
jgi:L-serine dehydratase